MKLLPLLRRSWPVAVWLGSALPLSADVLVVDAAGGPGSSYTTISDAVAAAVDGDTILVRPGQYDGFNLFSKSLSVIADGDGVEVDGYPAVYVSDIAADQEVLVRGLHCTLEIYIRNCDGPVWIDEITMEHGITNGPDSPPCYGGPGIYGAVHGAEVLNSSQVTFTSSILHGCTGIDGLAFGGAAWAGDGMYVADSTVQVFDCQLIGGPGHSSSSTWYTDPGGHGLTLDNATVTIAGCSIYGGAGGIYTNDPCGATHEVGGAGVRFIGEFDTINSTASTAVGGFADLDALCPGLTGPAGPAIDGAGTIVPLFGHARHLRANSPVRGGETLTFEVEAQPGEIPLIAVSERHIPIPMLAQSGVLLIGMPPTDIFVLPPLTSSGQTTLSFPVPNVGAVQGSVRFYAQGVFLDATQSFWVGAGTSLTLLDSSY